MRALLLFEKVGIYALLGQAAHAGQINESAILSKLRQLQREGGKHGDLLTHSAQVQQSEGVSPCTTTFTADVARSPSATLLVRRTEGLLLLRQGSLPRAS